jgi:plastocyanin
MRTSLLLLLLTASALAGCSDSGDGGEPGDGDGTQTGTGTGGNGNGTQSGGPRTHDVSLQGNRFVNQTITIQVGDTVRWTHRDGNVPHNVESDDPAFDSHPNCTVGVPNDPPCMVASSPAYSRTFSEEGTVQYRCEIHPSMTGEVRVVGANATA